LPAVDAEACAVIQQRIPGKGGVALVTRNALPVFPFAVLLVTLPGVAVAEPASPSGSWVTQGGQSVVQFSPCATGWCGRLARILKPDPKQSQFDAKNPDPNLRARPLLGIRLLNLTTPDGDGWRGTVYDPRSGKTYKATVRRVGIAALDVQGCLMMFCQTQRWTAD